MSWDEPRTIAARLAAALGVPLRDASDAEAGAVLRLDAGQLAALSDEALRGAVALVVAGAPGSATSADLSALRDAVAARGLAPALTTFASVADDGGPCELPLVVAGARDDERLRALLAAGPHSLALDPCAASASASDDAPPARVCVVSFELAGMTGGGIGTAGAALAETLARDGHDVTLLFSGWQEAGSGQDNDRWAERCAQRGVRLAFLRAPGAATVKSLYFPARTAYEVYCWLRREAPFDVVHVPENMGQGVYAQLAKRQGTDFAGTTFAIGTHGPTRWAAEANRVALTHEDLLVNDALERTSIAHADALLSPSRYLLDYLRTHGWTLPERTYVQAYATPPAVRERLAERTAQAPAGDEAPPHELVFFGRLETRKGVVTLCDALDLLAAEDGSARPSEVTFLGPLAHVLGQPADAYVAARAERWPWPCRIVDDRDQQGAAAYLERPGVLAVMPSLVDNAPNTVSEAVALGIPFVAGRAGGTGELVAGEQRDDHMFGPAGSGPLEPRGLAEETVPVDPRPLAELLRRRLAHRVEPARPPFAPAAVDAAYDRWHRAVAACRRGRSAARPPMLPSLTVCLRFDGDAELLSAQRAALPEDVETVIVDLREHGLGRACADAVGASEGELIAFVPPGDVPLPAFATTLRHAAAGSRADVYSCAVLDGRGGAPDAADPALHAFVPLPGPPLAGLSHPAFAAGPYAIRRAALERLGGFAPDAGGDELDHELLNRAAASGLAFEVVSAPLAVKRRPDRWSDRRAAIRPGEAVPPSYDAEQWLRVERPFAAADDDVRDVVGLLRGAREDALRLARDLRRQHDAYEQRFAEQRVWIDNLEDEAAVLRAELPWLRALRRFARRVRRRVLPSGDGPRPTG